MATALAPIAVAPVPSVADESGPTATESLLVETVLAPIAIAPVPLEASESAPSAIESLAVD